MIITLKSNNADGSTDGNLANDFTNFFPDSLILKKNSEIGVLSCTYNLQEGLDVLVGVNNSMNIVIPPRNVLIPIEIPVGAYTNDDLASALQGAIRGLTVDDNQNNLYPLNGAVCTITSKNELQIDLPWNPQNGTIFSLNTNYMRKIGDIDGGVQLDGDSSILYLKTSATNTFASNSLISDNGAGEFRELYAMSQVIPNLIGDNSFFGSYEFEISSTDEIDARIALSHSGLVDISQAPIQLGIEVSGVIGNPSNILAFEQTGGGTATSVVFSPEQTAVAGDRFRILIPVQYDKNTPTTHAHAIYQKYDAANIQWNTMPVVVSTQRYTISVNDQFLFRASIKTPFTTGIIGTTTTSPTLGAGVIDRDGGFVIRDGGSGYVLGEEVQVNGGIGGIASFYVNNLSATGAITAVNAIDWRSGGRGFNPANNITLTGLVSGSTSARGDVTAIMNAVNVVNGGDNYGVDELVNCATAGFTNLQIQVKTVDAGGSGIIQTFIITQASDQGYTGQQLFFNPPTGGAAGDEATISFAEYGEFWPSIANLKTNGLVIRSTTTPIFHPLALQQNIRMETGVLGSEIGLPPTIRSDISADFTTAGIQEVGDEIVSANRLQNNLLIHLDNFPIKSIHKGGQGRCVAALPLGDNSNTHAGLFQDRVYNLVYHSCENKEDENYNQMRVRMTDAEGNKIVGLQHPVIVNLDLRPRSL